jgi:rare lipoprotein A
VSFLILYAYFCGKIILMFIQYALAFFLLFSGGHLAAQWTETGTASYYSDKMHGQRTASGELYDKYALTAAHHLLPLGSRIRVTRLDTRQSVEVRVNDCFKTFKGRVVDLSRAAAEELNLIRIGTAQVKVELISRGKGKPCTPGALVPDLPQALAPLASDTTIVRPDPVAATASTRSDILSPPAPGVYRVEALQPVQEGFGVQVGAFQAWENAILLLHQLQRKDIRNLLVALSDAGGNTPFKVMVGPYHTREEALAMQSLLLHTHQLQGMLVDLAK